MTQVPTHPRMRQPKPNNNNMKIRTSIEIEGLDAEYTFELSKETPMHTTTITEKMYVDGNGFEIVIPNNDLKKFVEAIQEHIKIHGL